MSSKNVKINRIVENIEKVIVSNKESIELMCIAIICEGHVLIEDVPGTGKTTLALALAKTIDCTFKRVSCTPDVMPSDITGFTMYNPKTKEFEYREGSIMANIFLADEINRTPPKTQSGLLEAMEERFVTIDGEKYNLPNPFLVIATQNPIEYLGTYPLPEAQLDRFLMRIKLGYPKTCDEKEIIKRFTTQNPLKSLESVTNPNDFLQLIEEVKQVQINDKIMDYIVELVQDTRSDKDIALGLSPRSTLWIAKASKAWAYYNGRDFVIPDDVKYIFPFVSSHRIILEAEAKYENKSCDSVLGKILEKVKVPV